MHTDFLSTLIEQHRAIRLEHRMMIEIYYHNITILSVLTKQYHHKNFIFIDVQLNIYLQYALNHQ